MSKTVAAGGYGIQSNLLHWDTKFNVPLNLLMIKTSFNQYLVMIKKMDNQHIVIIIKTKNIE